MLLQEKSSHVVRTEGSFQQMDFAIAATPQAYSILSDRLYSDKIRAVIRELSTNAYDSHVVAGNTQPFHIHVPTSTEPWFKIRDFGTGITDEQAKGIYRTYFSSDKTHTNDLCGQLGLGSKSPLSCASSFTVTSYVDGVKRVYVVSLNERRIPELNSLNDEQPTSEPNGLEIQVAARPNEITEWHNKAVTALTFFNGSVRPKIINNDYLNTRLNNVQSALKANAKVSGSNWLFFLSNASPISSSGVVMGNVFYPINAENLNLKGDQKHIQLLLENSHVVLYANIGDIEFTPSREELAYTKATIRFVVDRLQKVIEELRPSIQAQVDAQKSLWDARLYLQQQLFLQTYLKGVSFTYNGAAITQVENIQINPSEFNITTVGKKHSYGKAVVAKDLTTSIVVSNKSKFYFVEPGAKNTNKTTVMAHARHQIREDRHEFGRIYVLTNGAALDAFLALTGMVASQISNVKTLSSPSAPRGLVRTFNNVLEFNQGGHGYQQNYWHNIAFDKEKLDQGGVYVEVKNKSVMNGTTIREPGYLKDLLKMVEAITDKKVTVIGVRKQELKTFKKNPRWTLVWDYAKQAVDNTVKELLPYIDVNINMITMHQVLVYQSGYNSAYIKGIYEKFHRLIPNHPLTSFLACVNDVVLKHKQYGNRIDTLRSLTAQGVSLQLPAERQTVDVKPALLALNKKYTLLEHLDWLGSSCPVKEIVEYISAIDKINS